MAFVSHAQLSHTGLHLVYDTGARIELNVHLTPQAHTIFMSTHVQWRLCVRVLKKHRWHEQAGVH